MSFRIWVLHEGDAEAGRSRALYDVEELVVDTPASISVEYSQLVITPTPEEETP